MSFTVNHLNDDSTFLLTFAPPNAPTVDGLDALPAPGTFTVLIDPWLEGHYTVWRPSFAIAYHTKEPSIPSLADLHHAIDLIIISQDKSDHCHEETLCSLPRDTNIRILATPAAAKKIWSWKYFKNPSIVQVIPPYNCHKPETIVRIPIDAPSSGTAAGEITVANMPTKLDMANLHNAIGITYCPPSAPVDITASDFDAAHDRAEYYKSYSSSVESDIAKSWATSKASDNREKTLSILYSPHGVSMSAVQPYVTHHLATLNEALPLTALFHSLNIEANPWYMGGIVSAGAPGGVKLARTLRAKYWIGAHDEIKDASGVAIRFIRKERFDMTKTYDMLRKDDDEKFTGTELAILECGEERRFMG